MMKKINDLMAWLLRSRWHRFLSGNTLLLTVTGRRSGRAITLPVNYMRVEEELWVLSSRERTWWRNLIGGEEVRFWLQGRELAGRGEAVLDEAQIVKMLKEYLRAMPNAARLLKVKRAGDDWDAADLRRAAAERLMVRLSLGGD